MSQPRRVQLANVINNRVSDGAASKQLSEEIAAYLLETGRVSELDVIIRDVIGSRADQGIVEVIATSAHKLTPEIRAKIKAKVKAIYPTANRIIISEKISPEQVGGIRLELPGKSLDLSVRNQLNRFKQLMIGN